MTLRLPAALAGAALLLAACAAPPPAADGAPPPDCPTARAEVPNADYIGRYAGLENAVGAREFAQDLHCADRFKAARFPAGFVTVFGSSRIRDDDPAYALVRRVAAEWTRRHGNQVPVMTGAGPGLMEAANRGAREAGGPSVGYTTYYDRPTAPDPLRPYGGDPRQALNAHVTHGLIFTSVTARELAMLRHSAAVLVAPGGTGTEWELFQLVEMIKSRQLAPVPVYLLGDRTRHWASLQARLDDMVARGTIRREEVAFLRFADDADALVRQLEADLRLR
jgi:predicted Rossmann-fold nucleotide-binding protein